MSLVNDASLRTGEMPQTVSLKMADALKWATINGAKAVHLDPKTGSSVPGKQADLIMLNTDALNLLPVSDPVSSMTFMWMIRDNART